MSDANGPLAVAKAVSKLLQWDWLDASFSPEARRFLPPLLIAAYLTHHEGRLLNKREASRLMGVDAKRTGPRYIKLAKERDLLAVEDRSAVDRRHAGISATNRLITLLERQLMQVKEMLDLSQAHQEVTTGTAEEERPTPRLIVQVPDEIRPHVRKAGYLVERFLCAKKASRSEILRQLAQHTALSAQVSKTNASVAVVREVQAVDQKDDVDEEETASLVRQLFGPFDGPTKIVPGMHHFAFKGNIHPDDLQVAHSVWHVLRHALDPKVVREADGVFLAGDFCGTLLLLGGATSNALTRLVREYRRIPGQKNGFAPSKDHPPIIELAFVPDADVPAGVKREPRHWGVLARKTGTCFHARWKDGRQETDWLTLTVIPNMLDQGSFERGGKIVNFAGLHGTGTKATSLLLRNHALLNRLALLATNQTAWQALFEIARIDHDVAGSQPARIASDFFFEPLSVPDNTLEYFLGKPTTEKSRAKR